MALQGKVVLAGTFKTPSGNAHQRRVLYRKWVRSRYHELLGYDIVPMRPIPSKVSATSANQRLLSNLKGNRTDL